MVAQDYPDADHYSFDDAQTRHTALTDSIAFLDQHGDGLMVIDEFQRAPDFILPPKAEVDTHRGTGRFLSTKRSRTATGNASPDNLAGRIVGCWVRGLSQKELAGVREASSTRY
ncbi:hypothetical protein KB1_01800 [Cutibacterium modestum]|uniref:AAA domain-containing protein n=2 Tax=Cutibacterium modestum TaxID=2559073 RepID=A0AAD1KM00_9ACTN|nr:hypothetical protein KB1_01800 [Cutibacterium modestum]